MHHTLPYAPDDDTKARAHLETELRHPDLARWRAMCSDTYLLQTYRLLCALDRDIDATFARRRAELAATQAAYSARQISAEQRATERARFERWKANAITFRNKIHERRDQLVPRVRDLRGDTGYQHLRDSYLALAAAVAQHRTTLTRQDPHGEQRDTTDRMLWALLDVLTIPASRTTPEQQPRLVSLINTVTHERPSPPTPHRTPRLPPDAPPPPSALAE